LDDAFHALKALEPRRNNQSFFVGGSELPRDFEDLCKDSQPQKLLVWSAPDSSALLRVLDAYSFHFKQTDFEGYTEGEYLQNLAHTLGRRRSEYSQKAFAVLTASQLEALQTHVTKPSASPIQDHSLLLVFTGQGAQWKGMGNQLLTYPVFQQSIARWNRYLHEMGCKWSLLGTLAHKSLFWLRRISYIVVEHFQMCDLVPQIDGSAEVSQSACTALQIALVDLLHSVSTSPKIVIGHSSGEIAAAYVFLYFI
jgi:acyl transferase domain-containing protein